MTTLSASTSPRVLFIAPVEPWCRENGSSIVISDLLRGVASVTDLELMCVFLRDGPRSECAPGFPVGRVVRLSAEGLPKWTSIGKAVLTGGSPLQNRFDNRRVASRVLAAVNNAGFVPSVVHVEHLPVFDIGKSVARRFNAPLVLRAHNIESQLWARRLQEGGAIQRWLVSRVERGEQRAFGAADLLLSISPVDQQWITTHVPRANAAFLPSSIALQPYERFLANTSARRQLCFVGGLDWGPNDHGLRWFVENVLPAVRSRDPEVRLVVLARGAESRRWLTDNPCIEIAAPETEAGALFASSRASIAPLLQGGGVRIKILESLAVGCPVVATRIGGEGLSLKGLTCSDVVDELADACATHLREDVTQERRASLRESVDDSHGSAEVGRQLAAHWRALCARTDR